MRLCVSRYSVVTVLALLAFTIAACSDDNKDETSTPTGSPSASDTASPTTPQPGGGDATEEPSASALTDSNLSVDLIEGLDQPTQVVFLGADDLLVSEKTGAVVRVTDGTVSGPVLELAANYSDERGVLGLTLHPDFATNNFVYLYWTWTGVGTAPEGLFGPTSDDIEQVPENGNRIDRFVWDGTKLNFDRNIIELPSKTTDLTLDRRRGNHDGGVIMFGPDGKLYAVIGDQNVRGELTNVQDGPAASESGIVAALLRLNDDGTIPTDNPFAADPDLAPIYLYGVRNSFGYDFDPKSEGARPWLVVNGQASYDEIGHYDSGNNVGWIQLMGPPDRFADYKALEIDTERLLDNPAYPPTMLADTTGEALERLISLSPTAEYREPLFAWRYAVAPAGFHFIEGTALGAQYDGDLIVGDVNTGSLWHFDLTPDREGLALTGALADNVNDNEPDELIGEMSDQIFGTGFFVATDIESGPDGSLWITSIAANGIYHITAE